MGNTTSVTAGRDCLISAPGGDAAHVAFQDQLLYQATAVDAYNLNLPVTPVAVTDPQSADEIAAVVKCASDYDYKVQARSGGHSFANYGLGGQNRDIVVNMKHFSQFSMDESTFIATIGPGITLGDLDLELYNAGNRAMAHGICPSIRTGDHLAMGGLGPTVRQWGLALDHVDEFEVVLANSSIVRASETQNPDVLFAIKRAAASFGIVTEFKVRTEQARGLAVQYSYTFNLGTLAEKANLLKDWQAFIAQENLIWRFYSNLVIFDGQEYDALGLEKRFPTSEPGTLLYIHKANAGALAWLVTLSLEGGAINAVPDDVTAYSHRDVLFWVQIFAVNPLDPVSQTMYDFADGLYSVLAQAVPESAKHAYLGCPDPRMPDAQREYWRDNLPRLEELKGDLDPKGIFHNPGGVEVVL
ncbi:uncharacterized protein BJX67DRAFT_375679 [Aspergillus lucknowensis]|uniref:FAD-binding PCMH-type domain-containing protein n=1 Tax=Aspergillus lucknowensis TaxID=176173 RepID=A0ABR4L8Y7_9EURO